jgi:hypothetical protein
MNKIPFLRLRMDLDNERMGVDKAELGEAAYDYIEASVMQQQTQRLLDVKRDEKALLRNESTDVAIELKRMDSQ